MSNNHDNVVDVETDVDTNVEDDGAPTKSRVSYKAGSKKAAEPKKKKPTNQEALAKREAVKKRHEEACNLAAEKGLVSYFKLLVESNFADHLGKTVVSSALETIDERQKSAATRANGYNPFPATDYKLLNDTKTSHSKAKQASKSNGAKPASQPVVRKKGAKVQEPVEPQPESEEEHEEHEEQEETDMGDEDTEEKAVAPKTKKGIAQVTSAGKTYLALLVSKVTDEALDLTDGTKVKTRDDLVKFVYNDVALKEANKSQILRSVITSVDRLTGVLPESDDKLSEKYLAVAKTGNAYVKTKHVLAKHVSVYIAEYIRLIGHVVAKMLWVSKKQINQNTIELAMSMLDFGNHQYLLSKELTSEDEPTYDLNEGYFDDAREYLSIVLPPKAPVVRKPRKKPEDADASAAPVEPSSKKSTKKAAPAKEVRKPKAVEVEYEEGDDEEAEEDDDAEVEPEEEEEEEDPEEAPKKTRSLKPSRK